MTMARPQLVPSAWQVLAAAAFAVLLGRSAFAQVNGTTNILYHVDYRTGMWSLADPFAFQATSNLQARATSAEAAGTTLSNRLNAAESGVSALDARLTTETNRATAAEAALAQRSTALESLTNAAASAQALALTALQPPATNALDAALSARIAASTNAVTAALGPRISALEGAGYLPAAATNGWEVSSHAAFVTSAAVVALVNSSVDYAVGSLPNLPTIVLGVFTNNPSAIVSNSIAGMIAPLLSVSNGVSPVTLAQWWSTNSAYEPAENFTWVTNTTGGAVITGWLPGVSGRDSLVLPPALGGHPVEAIGTNCFYATEAELRRLVVPATVRDLWPYALSTGVGAGCDISLSSVTNVGFRALYEAGADGEAGGIPAVVRLGPGLQRLGVQAFADAYVELWFSGDAPAIDETTFFNTAGRAYRPAAATGYDALIAASPGIEWLFSPQQEPGAVVINGTTNIFVSGVADLGALAGGGASGVSSVNGATGAVTIAYLEPQAVSNAIDAAINALPPQPTGVPYWVSSNGLNFATIETNGTPTLWGVSSSSAWLVSIPEDLLNNGSLVQRATNFFSDAPYPITDGSYIGFEVSAPAVFVNYPGGSWYAPYGDAGAVSHTLVGVDGTPPQTGVVNLYYIQDILSTNIVTTFALATDLTNLVTRAEFLAGNLDTNAVQSVIDLWWADAGPEKLDTLEFDYHLIPAVVPDPHTQYLLKTNAAAVYATRTSLLSLSNDVVGVVADSAWFTGWAAFHPTDVNAHTDKVSAVSGAAHNLSATGTLTLNGSAVLTNAPAPVYIGVATATNLAVTAGTYYIDLTDWAATGMTWGAGIDWPVAPDMTMTGRYEFAFSTLGTKLQGRQVYPTCCRSTSLTPFAGANTAAIGALVSSTTFGAALTNYIATLAGDPLGYSYVTLYFGAHSSSTGTVQRFLTGWGYGSGSQPSAASLVDTGATLVLGTGVYATSFVVPPSGLAQGRLVPLFIYGVRPAAEGSLPVVGLRCSSLDELRINAYKAGWRP